MNRQLPLLQVQVVLCTPAPRKTTLPLLEKQFPLNEPVGTLTTVLFGAEARAAVQFAAFGVEKNVLQAAVVQFAHDPLGMPPGIPA